MIETARTWRDHDPDPATRAELTRLIDAADGGDAAAVTELGSRFRGPLTFGTAGPVSYTHLTLPTILRV